jgi:hypothetical protein
MWLRNDREGSTRRRRSIGVRTVHTVSTAALRRMMDLFNLLCQDYVSSLLRLAGLRTDTLHAGNTRTTERRRLAFSHFGSLDVFLFIFTRWLSQVSDKTFQSSSIMNYESFCARSCDRILYPLLVCTRRPNMLKENVKVFKDHRSVCLEQDY